MRRQWRCGWGYFDNTRADDGRGLGWGGAAYGWVGGNICQDGPFSSFWSGFTMND